MKKDNIFGIVIMACGLLLVLSVFLPFITYFSTSYSLWKMEDSSRFIYILLGLFVIVLYLINKKTEMAYLAAGYGTFSTISSIISLEGFSGLSIGFYLIMLSSITIGILTFLYNEDEADALIDLSMKVNNSVIGTNQNTQQMRMMPEPIMQPRAEFNNQNQSMGVPVNRSMHFDPMTGEPINTNNN